MRQLGISTRRDFLQLGAAALMGAGLALESPWKNGGVQAAENEQAGKGFPLVVPGYFGSRAGVQLGTQMPASASAEDMQFARQLGVEWVMTGLPAAESTLENYQALIRRFAAGGLKVYRLANDSCHNMEEVTLNLPGRDEKIAKYLDYFKALN